MTTKERLQLFVTTNGFGRNKFEKYVGIGNGYLSSKSKSITSDAIEKVYEKFPGLNLDWLITGRGDMFKSTLKIGDNISGNSNLSNTGSIGGHNIQITSPSSVKQKIIRDRDFEMTYESLPDETTQHDYSQLLEEFSKLKLEKESLLNKYESLQEQLNEVNIDLRNAHKELLKLK